MISLDHISAFRLASSEALLLLEKMARKINAVLKSYFERREIVLADLELEFGMRQDQLLLGDALTPDTCQLWDFRGSQKPNSKSFQVDDTGDAGAAYEALYQRIVG
jgi:phosphoribosylaminoimidazole-succinocarboxamide synthase